MSRYGYLKVFQRVPWTSRYRESTVSKNIQECHNHEKMTSQDIKRKREKETSNDKTDATLETTDAHRKKELQQRNCVGRLLWVGLVA